VQFPVLLNLVQENQADRVKKEARGRQFRRIIEVSSNDCPRKGSPGGNEYREGAA
jgi:hypothetical protein